MRRDKLAKNVVGIFMGIVSIAWFFPIYFMFINTFKPLKDVVLNTAVFPESFYFGSYVTIWENTPYLLMFKNSFIITFFSVLGIVIFGSMAGYKLARANSKWAYFLIMYFILTLIIPFQAVMIPLVKIMNNFNLIDSIIGIILVYIAFGSPLAIFLYHGAVKAIPKSLEESATIDGAGPYRTFFKVIFPLLTPITSTVVILQTLYIWNDFLLPLITLQSTANQTLPLGTTALFFGQYGNKWDLGITAIFMASLPMIILYMIMQKYIIKGIVSGATKG